MKKVFILIFFGAIPILYLCSHNLSFRMTRQIADLEEEKKLMNEQLEQSKIDAAKAYSYPVIEAKAIAIGLTYPFAETLNQKATKELTALAKQNGNIQLKCKR